MPRKTVVEKSTPQKQKNEFNNTSEVMSNEFIALDDLVYAPIHALAESNLRLHTHIIDTVKNMGAVKQDGQNEIIHLENLKIAYDQIHPDGEEGYSIDKMQLEVPLLSIIPVTNMNVEKAEIAFSAEIRAVSEKDGIKKVNARITSPEQRETDFLPRVSYKMSISSLPATEGFLRLSDMMSANQLAKKTDTTPVNVNGSISNDEEKDAWKELTVLKNKIKRLQQLYQKVSEILAEQQKLHQISEEAFPEDTYDIDETKYKKIQSKITNKIMDFQDQILKLEIQDGLQSLKEEDEKTNE